MKPSHFVKATALAALTYVSCSLSAQTPVTVTGSGTANNIPKFSGAATVVNSQITDNGTTVSLGTASVAIGAPNVISGEFVSIVKHQSAKTKVAVRNILNGAAVSTEFSVVSAHSTLSMNAFPGGFSPNAGIFESSTAVLNASGTGGINIGTTANAQLSFWTNNTKRMTVTNTGSVGIGTATPDRWFTVVSPTANSQVAKFADDTRYIGLGKDEVAAYMLNGALADMFIGSNYTSTYIRGNVAIGTNTPKEHFQIGDRFVFHDGGYKFFGYNVFFAGSQNERIIANEASSLIGFGSSGDINFETAPSGPLAVSANATSKLFIKNTGEIGIGTSTPGKTLTVMGDMSLKTSALNAFDILDGSNNINFRVTSTGKVYAREVNVQMGVFPDYVFNKEYKLTPLNEVETYINVNKHLKGFEAAAEYEANGMNMGEVVRLQQEKIEELTLYLIEQQKQLDELKKQMDSLKK
ncbi:MAG: hypothetical protein V4677_02215 [Bacteroidota bacterium]